MADIRDELMVAVHHVLLEAASEKQRGASVTVPTHPPTLVQSKSRVQREEI